MRIAEKKNKGFSLIELMAVIGIIAIMSMVGIVSLLPAMASSRVKAAQREVAGAIRLAQSYTLQGRIQGGVAPCGYGFRFDPTDSNRQKYQIFYNPADPLETDDCAKKNSGTTPGFRRWRDSPPVSQVAESGSLKNGVDLVLPSLPSLTDASDTEIYFTNPNAKMYDKTGAPYSGKEFKLRYSSLVKSIFINASGTITDD